MADSGALTMLADNATQEAIAPFAVTEWKTLTVTGHRDINVLIYVSGYQAEWDSGTGWAIMTRLTVGDNGIFFRIAPAAKICIRVQGPVGKSCRVVVS